MVEKKADAAAMVQPPLGFAADAHVSSFAQYLDVHAASVRGAGGADFWRPEAERIGIESLPGPGAAFAEWNFNCDQGPVFARWMPGARANAAVSCLDRHVQRGMGNKVAYFWEGNEPEDSSQLTYGELLEQVCKCSNVLLRHGVRKGDCVAIYMPMVPEIVVAMLACARIGALHTVVFAGFSAGSLSDRIIDSKSKVVITADGVFRGKKLIPLKSICNEAIFICEQNKQHQVHSVLVVPHLTTLSSWPGVNRDPQGRMQSYVEPLYWVAGRDLWWDEEMSLVSDWCEPVWLDADDPMFLLYTSGSTGKPKGVMHTVAGYMLYAATTFKYVFDHKPETDIFWCTADIGWITGHTCVVYGPLLNGGTSVFLEGVPTHPHGGRIWDIVDKYGITHLYTAPTAIRLLMKLGDALVKKYSRKSLRLLATAGETINPAAWLWFYEVVGEKRCPVVDTFWQTETGGPMVTSLPGAHPAKPGSVTLPFFGVMAAILTEEGEEIKGVGEGYLVFKQPWPGMMKTIFNDNKRFERTYFHRFPGYFATGDGARRDEDGYIWMTGRIDDMLNVSGHLLSTAEVESCLAGHPDIAEAAAVSTPHVLKGESIYCFITPKDGVAFDDRLVAALKARVRRNIGAFAVPDYVQNAPALPKTRSGKIMRRILRSIVSGSTNFGDLSTLAETGIIDILWNNKLI